MHLANNVFTINRRLFCPTSEITAKLRSGAKILETWYLLPPSPLKQCCSNDSMPSGLLKWSTQHCLWGRGGGNSQ